MLLYLFFKKSIINLKSSFLQVLDRVQYRVEWQKYQDREKRKEEDEKERERSKDLSLLHVLNVPGKWKA